jgi:hypothetical protein
MSETTPAVETAPAEVAPVLGGTDATPPTPKDAPTQPPAEAKVDEKKADAPADDAAKKAADEKAKTDEAAKVKAAEDAKVAEAKKAEEAKALEKAWAEFKPKLPDGVALDEAIGKELVAAARESGLKPEQAQKFVDLHVKARAAEAKQGQESLQKEVDGWIAASKADKEFAQAKFEGAKTPIEAVTKIAQRAFDKFATPELLNYLRATGLNANTEFLRAFYRVGLAMQNDSISGTAPGGSAPTEESALKTLYPSMFPKS